MMLIMPPLWHSPRRLLRRRLLIDRRARSVHRETRPRFRRGRHCTTATAMRTPTPNQYRSARPILSLRSIWLLRTRPPAHRPLSRQQFHRRPSPPPPRDGQQVSLHTRSFLLDRQRSCSTLPPRPISCSAVAMRCSPRRPPPPSSPGSRRGLSRTFRCASCNSRSKSSRILQQFCKRKYASLSMPWRHRRHQWSVL